MKRARQGGEDEQITGSLSERKEEGTPGYTDRTDSGIPSPLSTPHTGGTTIVSRIWVNSNGPAEKHGQGG